MSGKLKQHRPSQWTHLGTDDPDIQVAQEKLKVYTNKHTKEKR